MYPNVPMSSLSRYFLFAIIILTSCNQKTESNTETSVDENQLDIILVFFIIMSEYIKIPRSLKLKKLTYKM